MKLHIKIALMVCSLFVIAKELNGADRMWAAKMPGDVCGNYVGEFCDASPLANLRLVNRVLRTAVEDDFQARRAAAAQRVAGAIGYTAGHYSLDFGRSASFLTSADLQAFFSFYPAANNVNSIDLCRCTGLTDISALRVCAGLQKLYLYGCTFLTDLNGLQGCARLQELNLSGCTGLTDISALQWCAGLERLGPNGCTSLTDLNGLHGRTGLQGLSLNGCTSLTNLNGLQGCTGLQVFYLDGCTKLSVISDEDIIALTGSARLSIRR